MKGPSGVLENRDRVDRVTPANIQEAVSFSEKEVHLGISVGAHSWVAFAWERTPPVTIYLPCAKEGRRQRQHMTGPSLRPQPS